VVAATRWLRKVAGIGRSEISSCIRKVARIGASDTSSCMRSDDPTRIARSWPGTLKVFASKSSREPRYKSRNVLAPKMEKIADKDLNRPVCEGGVTERASPVRRLDQIPNVLDY
jgi:hypothetical protein